MNRILVWDLPTRIFHWGFALLLVASIVLALVADEHGTLFRWHMLCGLGALGFLVLRIPHGFVGSRYARFGSFPLKPTETVRYVVGVFSGRSKRYPGHNPGSALAALTMSFMVLGLGMTGVGLGGEEVREAHGSMAYLLMAVIGLHLAGIAIHTWRHRENIGLSMVTGRKAGMAEDGLKSSRPLGGLAFLVVGLAWAGGVLLGYDDRAGTTRLPLAGTVIQLGDHRSNHEGKQGRTGRHHDDD